MRIQAGRWAHLKSPLVQRETEIRNHFDDDARKWRLAILAVCARGAASANLAALARTRRAAQRYHIRFVSACRSWQHEVRGEVRER